MTRLLLLGILVAAPNLSHGSTKFRSPFPEKGLARPLFPLTSPSLAVSLSSLWTDPRIELPKIPFLQTLAKHALDPERVESLYFERMFLTPLLDRTAIGKSADPLLTQSASGEITEEEFGKAIGALSVAKKKRMIRRLEKALPLAASDASDALQKRLEQAEASRDGVPITEKEKYMLLAFGNRLLVAFGANSEVTTTFTRAKETFLSGLEIEPQMVWPPNENPFESDSASLEENPDPVVAAPAKRKPKPTYFQAGNTRFFLSEKGLFYFEGGKAVLVEHKSDSQLPEGRVIIFSWSDPSNRHWASYRITFPKDLSVAAFIEKRNREMKKAVGLDIGDGKISFLDPGEDSIAEALVSSAWIQSMLDHISPEPPPPPTPEKKPDPSLPLYFGIGSFALGLLSFAATDSAIALLGSGLLGLGISQVFLQTPMMRRASLSAGIGTFLTGLSGGMLLAGHRMASASDLSFSARAAFPEFMIGVGLFLGALGLVSFLSSLLANLANERPAAPASPQPTFSP